MLESGGVDILLDVRTRQEYAEDHIPGSLLLEYPWHKERVFAVLPDKNAVILVYCYGGGRSCNAVQSLIRLGYKNIYEMDGGYLAWEYEA